MIVKQHRNPSGYMLFETLLAITIFGISMASIHVALHKTSDLVRLVERESWVQKQFETALTEVLKTKQTKLEFEEEKVIPLGEFGAEAHIEVIPSEIESAQGRKLQNFYEIVITITWLENNEERTAVMETYQYFPLYQN